MNRGRQTKKAVGFGMAVLLASACGPAENEGGQAPPPAAELRSQQREAAPVQTAGSLQDGVYLCVDANYLKCRYYSGPSRSTGSSSVLVYQFGQPDGENDAYSSIRIVGGYRARLFKDTNFRGGWEDFVLDDANLADNTIGNDEASSMIIYQDDPNKDGVYLYTEAGYTGQWSRYTGSAGTVGYLNDIISSLKIVGRYKVTLYRDANYTGDSITFDPSIGGLPDVYTLDTYGFNDVVSSVKVERY